MESELWGPCIYRKADQIPSKPIILDIIRVFLNTMVSKTGSASIIRCKGEKIPLRYIS
jgi:hypothetical protein